MEPHGPVQYSVTCRVFVERPSYRGRTRLVDTGPVKCLEPPIPTNKLSIIPTSTCTYVPSDSTIRGTYCTRSHPRRRTDETLYGDEGTGLESKRFQTKGRNFRDELERSEDEYRSGGWNVGQKTELQRTDVKDTEPEPQVRVLYEETVGTVHTGSQGLKVTRTDTGTWSRPTNSNLCEEGG